MNGCITSLLRCALVTAALTQSVAAQQPEASPSQVVASRTPRELIGIAVKKSHAAVTDRDFAEMIFYLDKAIESEAILPSHRQYAKKLKGWAHNRLGEAFAGKGRDAAALNQFEQAVELNDQHWKAFHNRGVSYAMESRYDEALRDFSATVRINPKYANAWFNRGEVCLRLGKAAIAIENYSHAIELKSGDASFYAARAKAHQQLDANEKAIRDLDRAIILDDQLAEAFVERGDLNLASGDFVKASDDYRAAVRLDGQLDTAYRSIAWMMATCPDVRYRDTERAVTFAEKALRLHGEDDFRYLDTLSAALANAERFDEALTHQRKALKLAARAASGIELQLLQDRLQQYEQQLPHRQQRIASRPDSPNRTN